MCAAAVIHKIKIDRFRGIENLDWNPAPGMNVILGGGDVGKSTVLEAIALLLNPSNARVLSESDYWQRKTEDEFVIQVVISLPYSTEISQQAKFVWPWEWNGTEAIPPVAAAGDDDIPSPAQPVYCLQVRGTAELEISWEILQPNGDVDILSSAVRRKIGVLRLSGEERNDRDLRLVYGSALDRLLSDKGLRARIGQHVSSIDLHDKLSDDAKKAIEKLDTSLKAESLPNKLELGLTSSQGLSIGALIGLLAEREGGVVLPLASWGAGTRRMATLQIAAESEAETRITVIDEIERGLEPYRVRKLVKSIEAEPTQSFVTTHSAVAIGSADGGHLWYLDQAHNIGALPRNKIAAQQDRDPETFLSRLSIIAEGPTEIGFVTYLLERAIDGNFLDQGVRVCNGQGNPATLDLLEAMASGGLMFGGFVDDEGTSAGRWITLKATMGTMLFQWGAGSTEKSIIVEIPDDELEKLITEVEADVRAERCLTLADRLGIADRSFDAIKTEAADLRALIIAAATGSNEGAAENGVAKTWKKHGRRWFKSVAGGKELATLMFALGAWPSLRPQILPFLNAVRNALGQPELEDLPHE
ncbi:MAG: ATP-binding protein [Candidatus Thiodiazotropha sp. (ex Epidulcina cf. delphinae)]|nr:ATP-binding protein [Candidatus Thiodiazotropha sp. (ex Epidulcina cf. delphinae)]